MSATLHVCTTCRAGLPDEGDSCAGARLHAAIAERSDVRVAPVACLSACNNGCAVALSAPGKWSYVYGRMTMDDIDAIVEGASLYAASADGIVPWRERPTVFRKQSLARIPPMEPAE